MPRAQKRFGRRLTKAPAVQINRKKQDGRPKGTLKRYRFCQTRLGFMLRYEVPVVYGVLMNVSSALLWQSPVSWATIGAYLLSGFPVDCVHAAATVCFLWLFGEPMLEKLDRIKVKYGLLA